jgi:hypothetical protein
MGWHQHVVPCLAELKDKLFPSAALGSEPHNAPSVENARSQLLDRSTMIDRPRHIDSAQEREAEAILRAADQEVRYCVGRGIMERWLSRAVHCLNWLEGRAATLELARQALRRLGFLSGMTCHAPVTGVAQSFPFR